MFVLTVSNSHTPDKPRNSIFIEYIANHAIGLALVESTLWSTSHDPTSILTPMLEK